MSDRSLILELPYIQAAQAQKHVTHNEALRSLDTIVQLTVSDDTLTEPPASPAHGDRYIVPTGATGAWAGQDGAVAQFEGGPLWVFLSALPGWRAWVLATETLVVFDGTGWRSPLSTLSDVTGFGLNATPSPGTPFVARTPQALWDAVPPSEGGTGSMIQSLNRAGATSDGGLAFQTDYVTHGLFGFFGSDDLRLSVSPDGVSFTDAFQIDPATGIAAQPARPRFQGTVNYDVALPQDVWTRVPINTLDINPQGAFDPVTNLFTAPLDGSYLIGGSAIFVRDTSTGVRMAVRLVKNGSVVVPGSEIQNTGSQWNNASGVNLQTLVNLAAGDTLELQARARLGNALVGADRSGFWGVFIP